MADAPTRVFFAADIHGSQVTFRKFLAAADSTGSTRSCSAAT